MAWEIRGAVPDFPVTIFVEIQTSVMSTGLTLLSRTPRSISSYPLYILSATQTGYPDEKFLRSFFKKATVSPKLPPCTLSTIFCPPSP